MNNYSKILKTPIAWIAILVMSLFSTKVTAQCVAPTLTFHSPVLISGTDGQAGAIYLFANVNPGIDAHIEVLGLHGGASLFNIDDTTGIGYYDAFQPYVGANPNDTSYIDWKITFKMAGTDTDTILPCLAVTGVDVDGDNGNLKEFIEAATPGSIAVDPLTILNISFDGLRSKAIATTTNLPLIDTSRREAMFQMNFVNISTLLYRNGSVCVGGGALIRQTCIYFKPFFESSTFTILPAKILSFTAKSPGDFTKLEWSASNEIDTKSYTAQKSSDSKNWSDIQTMATGNGSTVNTYSVIDLENNGGITYYRLKQLNTRGIVTYSKIIKISKQTTNQNAVTHNTIVTNSINFQVYATGNAQYIIDFYTMAGSRIRQDKLQIHAGVNATSVSFPAQLAPGTYVLVVKNDKGEHVHSSRLIKK